jgi:glycosyltransferase involved in cell wall biosynthesis
MKIKIIGPAYPYRGGLASFNERLAWELQNEGHQVSIETFTLQYPSFLFPGKSQFVTGDAPEGISISRTINSVNPFNWFLTGRRIAREAPDMVILRYWLPFMAPCFGTIARLAARNSSVRILTIADNIIPHEKRAGDRLLTRYFIKPVNGFIAMSRAVLSELSLFDTTTPRVLSPHPIFDNFGDGVKREDALRLLGLDPSYRYILFFGLIREYKGLDLFIRSMADDRVRALGIRALVAGEFYCDSKPYYKLIDDLKLAAAISVHPNFIDDDDVKLWFSAADLIVQPYKSATQSGVTQIGYHFEKPMLVTDTGGLPEIIPHMKAGYVTPPDPEAIAGAINDFFINNRSESFTEGIRDEKKRFGWDRLVKSIMSLYSETLMQK